MNKNTLWAVVAVLVILIAGVWWYASGRNTGEGNLVSNTPTTTTDVVPAPGTGFATGPTTTTVSPSTVPSKVTVNVEGGMFYFNPKEINVKKGQTVTIHFINKEGTHDWVIDEFNARTPRINGGQSADVTFVADKAGSFEYYCSVGTHRQMGMKGTLVVQ